jgi:hypothetical protein
MAFTAYEMPLQSEVVNEHLIEKPTRFVETLIQVFHE